MKKDILAIILANNCISKKTGISPEKIIAYLNDDDILTSVESTALKDYVNQNRDQAMAEIGDITEYWDRINARTNIHQTGEHATVHQADKIIMGNEITIQCTSCPNWKDLQGIINKELKKE